MAAQTTRPIQHNEISLENRVRHTTYTSSFVSVLLQNISSARLLLRINNVRVDYIYKLPKSCIPFGHTRFAKRNTRKFILFLFCWKKKNELHDGFVVVVFVGNNFPFLLSVHLFIIFFCCVINCYHNFDLMLRCKATRKKRTNFYDNNTNLFVSSTQ